MATNQQLQAIALILQSELKRACPVDTSRLRQSIKVRVIPGGLRIFMAEYGKDVEFGTAPHVIRPKNKKALKFKSGGKTIITKQVNHPGTRPNPFIRDTLYRKLPDIIKKVIG